MRLDVKSREKFLLPPAMKLGQGNSFTGVCDSVHRGVCLSACWDQGPLQDQAGTLPRTRQPPPPRTRHSPGPGRYPPPGPGRYPLPGPGRHLPPPEQGTLPPRDQAGTPPPPSRAYWEIESTSGWCASYWNAILFYKSFYF